LPGCVNTSGDEGDARSCFLCVILKCAGILHASCLLCACVWLSQLWSVHVIVCLFCACSQVRAWLLHASGVCMRLYACFVLVLCRLGLCVLLACFVLVFGMLVQVYACVWFFLLVLLLLLLLHLMLARAHPCCLLQRGRPTSALPSTSTRPNDWPSPSSHSIVNTSHTPTALNCLLCCCLLRVFLLVLLVHCILPT
jgi:hypothetical protein